MTEKDLDHEILNEKMIAHNIFAKSSFWDRNNPPSESEIPNLVENIEKSLSLP